MSNVEQVLSQTDPGDNMQRRLRYQASYGALLCLDLIVDDDLEAVFCEHHEDFLLNKKSGTYVGVQVKTRLPGEGPFKTTDEPVQTALRRFVSLELMFPNQFGKFVIVANCDFYDVGEAETNLRYHLARLRSNCNATFKGTIKDLIKELRTANKCKKQTVIDVLCKVHLEGAVPKFEDMSAVVTSKLATVRPDLSSYQTVAACAKLLIEKVLNASALSCDMPIRSHFVFSTSPSEALTQATINHKKITFEGLSAVLSASCQTLLVLASETNQVPVDVPTGHHILEKKMATGGISVPSITDAKDLLASAEYVLQQWLFRYGSATATQRKAHIDLAVRTRCSAARDNTYSEHSPFGSAMLAEVRTALMELSGDTDHVFGLKYEQLLGFASLATQECRIWWSDFFLLEDADASV